MLQVIREFIFELPSPDGISPRTITERITSLDHELWDHAMENDPVEVATPRVADKVLYGFWCLGREQPEMYVPHGRVYCRRICNR